MHDTAIATYDLTRCFGKVTAVDRLNLTVPKGELFGLIGPDGAGKTTTMRLLAAIMDPTAGEARIFGRHTIRDAESIKTDIGYMSQRFGLYPDLTVWENIDFYADVFGVGKKERLEKAERLLAFSNLSPFRHRLAGRLSGGMKQKLGLACALIHTPSLLLLDEPTNGVDPVSRRDFWRILHQLIIEGVTIVVTTAYLDEADRCHRVGLMHMGKLLACDAPSSLKRLLPHQILELTVTDARRAAVILRDTMPHASVGLLGDKLHLGGNDPRENEASATATLSSHGIEVVAMRQVEPALEDVFVYLVEKGRVNDA